jgi:hypothetical protein
MMVSAVSMLVALILALTTLRTLTHGGMSTVVDRSKLPPWATV